jgi:hypothetical protein
MPVGELGRLLDPLRGAEGEQQGAERVAVGVAGRPDGVSHGPVVVEVGLDQAPHRRRRRAVDHRGFGHPSQPLPITQPYRAIPD